MTEMVIYYAIFEYYAIFDSIFAVEHFLPGEKGRYLRPRFVWKVAGRKSMILM